MYGMPLYGSETSPKILNPFDAIFDVRCTVNVYNVRYTRTVYGKCVQYGILPYMEWWCLKRRFGCAIYGDLGSKVGFGPGPPPR